MGPPTPDRSDINPVRVEQHPLIPRTFLLLPGIGPKKERQLWRSGCADWTTYLEAEAVHGVSAATRRGHRDLLARAQDAWGRRDLRILSDLVPNREHWRFFPDSRRVGYLDIETTGADPRATVTVVGVHDGQTGTSHQLVAGHDLDHGSLATLLGRFDLLVTFNGNGFDLPVLENHYPGAVPAVPHLDLRGPLSRLGYKGGLKRIEVALGLQRPEAVVGVDGWEAVRLWRRYRATGDASALETLLVYNREDIINLEPLARFACQALYNLHCPYWAERPRAVPWPGGTAPVDLPPETAEALPEQLETSALMSADRRHRDGRV